MSLARTFLMAGGGTGGHVIPALVVARELRRRGHVPFFIGTRSGLEAKLVTAEGFPIEWIEIGGLKGVGLVRTLETARRLPLSVYVASGQIAARRPAAVFSMGGYVAGPVMLAAWLRRIPMILMEPNARPGFTNLRMARFVKKALVSFQEAARFFPPGVAEITGLPVRKEFFDLPAKQQGSVFNVLITGGSRGSKTLNEASKASWKLFRQSDTPIRIVHQAGANEYDALRPEFEAAGVDGEIVPFIQDMPAAFAAADLVICRSGAGAVAELAAAGKPAILVPFPFASDQHQLRNAEALERAGAARLVLDFEWNGERMFQEIHKLANNQQELAEMSQAVRSFAKPHAAERAADLLEELTTY